MCTNITKICTGSSQTTQSETDNSNTVGGYELGSMVNMDIPASANVEDTGMHANIN